MDPSTRLDRSRGCLLGLAVGDALGAPLEGLSCEQIRAYFRRVVDYVDGSKAWKKKPHRWRLAGLYTDDTQQALVLADVLLDCGRLDLGRVADLYLELATPDGPFLGAHRGVGRSFRQVIEELRRGACPRTTGQDSAGVGAAMRIAPVAIYYATQPEAMFEAVLDASLMTHRDCRSLAGAMAVAHAIRRIGAGAEREPSFALRLAADVARAEDEIAGRGEALGVASLRRHAHSLSQAIARVESLLDLPVDEALRALVDEANRHGAEPRCRKPTMGFPPACIPACVYVFLSTNSFEQALTCVVNLGGDADTAGAILGAMAGAYYGAGAIPSRWLAGLHNRAGVELRSEALANRSRAGLGPIPDLVATERELSAIEASCRDRQLSQRLGGAGRSGGAGDQEPANRL